MTCFVPIFGTDRNIPAVPAGTERNLKPWHLVLGIKSRKRKFIPFSPHFYVFYKNRNGIKSDFDRNKLLLLSKNLIHHI